MSRIRHVKVGSLVKQELSMIFQRETAMHFDGLFITVTQVRMCPDLGLARVYLSFMAVKKPEAALTVVKKQANWTRRALGGVIGKQVRRIPELQFYIDDSLDYYEAVEKALKE